LFDVLHVEFRGVFGAPLSPNVNSIVFGNAMAEDQNEEMLISFCCQLGLLSQCA
jgi:hypothetical protein